MSKFFTLEQAEAVAPLVRSVLRSIETANMRLAELQQRDELLYECRHAADYRARLQYYRHCDEKAKLESELSNLNDELEETGAERIEAAPLAIGIPFKYNPKSAEGARRKKAYFLIQSQAETSTLTNFRIAGEHRDRDIPAHWRHGRKSQRSMAR